MRRTPKTPWLVLARAEAARLYNKPELTAAEVGQLLDWQRLGFSVREAVDFTLMDINDLIEQEDAADRQLNARVRRAIRTTALLELN